MSRRTRRFASVALTAIVAAVSLTGCAAGFNATTNQPYAPSNGSVAQIGNLRIRSRIQNKRLLGLHGLRIARRVDQDRPQRRR